MNCDISAVLQRTRARPWRSLAAAAAAALLALSTALPAQPLAVLITDPELSEISGLAASLRTPGRYWVHNDSGNPARLYAIDDSGAVRQRVDVRMVNYDWEDIATFRWQGAPWLAIADTGANLGLRSKSIILLLPEPVAVPEPSSTGVAKAIVFDYPQRMRDVEAMAVDAEAGQILLLEKIRPPTTLFVLDLNGPQHQQARVLATLPDWWPEPETPVETIGDRRYRGAPTAMDLSADGRRLAILTPTHWMVFDRLPHESWNAALQRQPRIGRLRSHELPWRRTIFEALGWGADGDLRISGERLPAPLLKIDPDQP